MLKVSWAEEPTKISPAGGDAVVENPGKIWEIPGISWDSWGIKSLENPLSMDVSTKSGWWVGTSVL